MLGVTAPPAIEAAAAKNYHMQTTPLSATHGVLEGQVADFCRGRARVTQPTNRLSLQRGVFLVRSKAERLRMADVAQANYLSFDRVKGGPGIVDRGGIRPLPRAQTAAELGQNILICEKAEMIVKLAAYAELGIDEVIVSSNFGQPQEGTLEMMSGFAAEVMPHLLPPRGLA